jgi:hypothetical protein
MTEIQQFPLLIRALVRIRKGAEFTKIFGHGHAHGHELVAGIADQNVARMNCPYEWATRWVIYFMQLIYVWAEYRHDPAL